MTARFGNLLTPDIERERAERLLLGDHLGAARREMPRLAADARRLTEARLDLREHTSLGEREIGDLSPALRDDPGLLFDETKLLRERTEFSTPSTS